MKLIKIKCERTSSTVWFNTENCRIIVTRLSGFRLGAKLKPNTFRSETCDSTMTFSLSYFRMVLDIV